MRIRERTVSARQFVNTHWPEYVVHLMHTTLTISTRLCLFSFGWAKFELRSTHKLYAYWHMFLNHEFDIELYSIRNICRILLVLRTYSYRHAVLKKITRKNITISHRLLTDAWIHQIDLNFCSAKNIRKLKSVPYSSKHINSGGDTISIVFHCRNLFNLRNNFYLPRRIGKQTFSMSSSISWKWK